MVKTIKKTIKKKHLKGGDYMTCKYDFSKNISRLLGVLNNDDINDVKIKKISNVVGEILILADCENIESHDLTKLAIIVCSQKMKNVYVNDDEQRTGIINMLKNDLKNFEEQFNSMASLNNEEKKNKLINGNKFIDIENNKHEDFDIPVVYPNKEESKQEIVSNPMIEQTENAISANKLYDATDEAKDIIKILEGLNDTKQLGGKKKRKSQKNKKQHKRQKSKKQRKSQKSKKH
jgi:hypothetical protein